MMEKVVVIGSTGLLGQNIMRMWKTQCELIGTYFKNKENKETIYLNLQNHHLVSKVLFYYKPSIVIDASRFNFQKMTPKMAIRTNNSNIRNLLSACNHIEARLLLISSDLVFDGKRGNYKEDDRPNPINLYGKLKFESEQLISHHSKDYLIVRTSLLFGWNDRNTNFATWVIENLRKNNKIQVLEDQYVSPSYCPDIARMILDAIQYNIKKIIHLAGDSHLTRLEFAKLICKIFSLNEDLLIPIKMDKIDLGMKRGKHTTLNVDKAQNMLEHKPTSAIRMLNKMRKDEK